MKNIKAVIFDMDGVLVDSEPFHVKIEKLMFEKVGLDISDEEHASYMGIATDVMWQKIIEIRNLSLNVEEMTQLTNSGGLPFFEKLDKIEPMPGLVRLLDQLKEKNIPVAVASSSDSETINIIMKKSGLRKYFLYTISSELAGKSKPAPDVFLYTAKLLNVYPENCLVIEDSKNGIKAAKTAGMVCVAYSGAVSDNQDQTEADVIFDDYTKLADYLFNSGNLVL